MHHGWADARRRCLATEINDAAAPMLASVKNMFRL